MGAITEYPLGSSLYLAVLIVGVAIIHEAQRRSIKSLLYLLIIFLALVFGLRAEGVGIDTINYLRYYNETLRYGPSVTASWYDTIYVYGMSLFSMEGGFIAFNFVVTLVTNALILCRLWDFRFDINLSLSFGLFYAFFIPVELNIARQLLAIAIVFWGSRYIFTHKTWLFVLLLGFAVSIHRAALIAVLLLLALYFIKDQMSYAGRTIFSVATLLLPLCAIVALLFLMRSGYFADYAKYFASNDIKVGLMTVIKVAILFIGFSRSGIYERFSIQGRASLLFTFIGLAMSVVGYLFDYMERIGYFFSIFDIVTFSYLALLKRESGSFEYERVLWLMVLYVLFTALSGNGQGILPYGAIWLPESF